METRVTLKNWGSSLGVVVPKDIIRKEHLREGEEVIIDIKRKESWKKSFGTLREWKINSQQAKDEARRDWNR